MTTHNKIRIKEIKPIDIEGGYLIDGFPSMGFTSAIATESMIHTSQFEMAGIIDSNNFPPVSLVKNGKPNYPTRIFVNNDLNVGVFSSYLTLHESLHRAMAKTMLSWAKKHKVSLIVSSTPVKELDEGKMIAAGSTDDARNKLKDAGIETLQHGTIPGLAGILLNEGMLHDIDVVVLLYGSTKTGPDFHSSAQLCMAMTKLVPGASCDIKALETEAEKAEEDIREAEEGTQQLKDSMYR